MHLLRLHLTSATTLRNGRVPVRVEAHRDRLLAVKRGEIEWPEVDTWRQQLHRARRSAQLVLARAPAWASIDVRRPAPSPPTLGVVM